MKYLMIKSFKHKGLLKFFESGSLAGIQAHHARKLQLILTRLDASICAEDMDLPGLRLHKLKGPLNPFHSVTVQANWRVIFQFKNTDAYNVDYIDYH